LSSALRESLKELQGSGFLPEPSKSERPAATPVNSSASKKVHPSSPAFPLTEAQKEIWLAAQMGGASASAYNESLKLDFRGPFDVELFRRVARTVVGRHPILMGSIADDGQTQQIGAAEHLELPLVDLSGRGENAAHQGLEDLIAQEASTPFNL